MWLLWAFLTRTLFGKAVLATAANRMAAQLVGVNTSFVMSFSFAASAAIGAVAGVLVTPITFTSYDVGTALALKGFAAAVSGGMGNPLGAVAGGLIIGLLEALGAGYVSSSYKDAIAFVVLDWRARCCCRAVSLAKPIRSASDMNRLLSSRYAALLFVAAVVIIPGLMLSSSFYFRVGALIFIMGFAALGLNLLMGYAGQVSLGHAGFIGIGAYATAALPTHFGFNIFAAMATGVAGAGLIAYIVGGPILRLKGHYLAVATLALGILIAMVITNEVKYTGGPDGMPVPRLEVFGVRLRTAQQWYWIAGGVLFLGVAAAQNLINSPTGRALRALHDSEVAAGTLGVDAARYKLIAFVISAMYAAIAGVCFALLNGHITPDSASFLRSVELVTMVVIGGMGSILGALVGAALLGVLEQWLAQFHEIETLVLGLIMMAVMIFMRDGIVPTVQRLLFSRRRT